jgi:signal peptidase II
VTRVDGRHRLAAVVAVAVVAADQLTKAAVDRVIGFHDVIPVTPFFAFTYTRNTGAAFGLLADMPAGVRLPLFLLITAVAAVALLSFLRQTPREQRGVVAALGAVLGGAAGNLICRLRYGEVIDFLLLHWGELQWPAFNVADSAITVGAIFIVLHSLFAGAPAGAAGKSATTR